ncbi:MAG: signal peptidase I [Patescibacteria group bacterium]|nr:signal peptidase I [Patescibacteria group bacterium]
MPEEKRDNFFTELLKFALIALIIVVPVRLFVAQPFIVSGASMVPTFETGQYLIVDELSYHFEAPQRGDVIIFRYPKDPSQFFIKRIIGLPGETVKIQNGGVYVTTTAGAIIRLPEPYVVNVGNGADQTTVLDQNSYFVMGDNRPESSDSRYWGTVPKANIIGRAFLRLLPIQNITILPGSVTEPTQ